MTKAQIYLDGEWQPLNGLTNPVNIGQRLDERLDEAVINIKGSTLEYIPPTTRIILTTDAESPQEKDHYFIVANDNSVEVPLGSGKYNHELSLIEATKLLEGIQCQTLTFTNSNGESYGTDDKKAFFTPSGNYRVLGGASNEIPEQETRSNNVGETYGLTLNLPSHNELYSKNGASNEPIATGSNLWAAWNAWEQAMANSAVVTNGDIYYKLEVKNENNGIVYSKTVNSSEAGNAHKINLAEYGQYTAVYTWHCYYFDDFGSFGYDITINYTYKITSSKLYAPLRKWNCKDVVNRTLRLAEPLFGSQTPRFKLDDEWATKLEGILAPEFSMTSANLREQLKQVGGFAHAEPRLKDFETVTFDKYGDNEEVIIDKPYISQGFGGNINDYAVQIDTYAENLVNASSEIAIVEPFAGGYRSLRTEEVNVRVNETNGVIQTSFPIYAIKEVKVKTENGFVDITRYVFESTLYNTQLSSFSGVYPYSKAYGLYYTIGEKNIKGLFFKAPAVVGQAYANYAIVNILKREGVDNLYLGYPQYKFVVSYLPIYNTRFRHGKGYIEGAPSQYTQVYNQTENLIETKYYGENIKGVAAKMGNAELTRTYFFDKYADIPQLGKNLKIDDELYKITAIDTSISGNRCKTTLSLSKHYNNISPYVGINSIRRFSEVSERQAYARQIVLPTYCVISRSSPDSASSTLIAESGVTALHQIFEPTTQPKEMTLARVTHVSKSGETKGDTMLLPVVSSAFGNCATFTFGFADNYSAGQSVKYLDESGVSGYWQADVPYADFYGNIEALEIVLYAKAEMWLEDSPFEIPAQKGDYGFEIRGFETATEEPYIIDKDSREIPQITMSLEFKTTESDIIIGSGLAKRLPFIKQTDFSDAEVYTIPADSDFVVGEFDNVIDVVNLVANGKLQEGGADFEENNGKLGITIASKLGVRKTKGWVIVTPRKTHTGEVTNRDGTIGTETYYTGGELILASRKPLKDQVIYSLDYVTLYFTNNI